MAQRHGWDLIGRHGEAGPWMRVASGKDRGRQGCGGGWEVRFLLALGTSSATVASAWRQSGQYLVAMSNCLEQLAIEGMCPPLFGRIL